MRISPESEKPGPRVAIFRGHLREGAGDIQFGDSGRGLPDSRGVSGGEQAQILKDLALQGQHLFFRVQNLAFQFLELRRGEAFGIHQRLLTLVIRGRVVQVGFRNFDVIAENVVEANLERLDSRAAALPRFNLGDVLAAVAADVAQLIQLGVEAGADGAAVGEIGRRLFRDGGENAVAHFGDFVERRHEIVRAGERLEAPGVLLQLRAPRANDRASASNSRGPAVPSVSFASSRSRSSTPASSFADFRHARWWIRRISCTASSRASISRAAGRAAAADGATDGRPCRCEV